MKQKVWVVNNIYPLVFKDDSCSKADFSKNKRNMRLDTYTKIFTNEKEFKGYIVNSTDHESKFIIVHEDEIEVDGDEINSEIDSNINNSNLIPYYKNHLFAVIILSEYEKQTNGSVAAIFVSEKNARKYADDLLKRLNVQKSRTVVKSYRVLVQPIPKEDIEKPGVNAPDPASWYLPPKK
jgi:hypothetical protein